MSLLIHQRTPMPHILAVVVTVAALASGACSSGGGYGDKAAEEQRRREHPCQFSATSKQCKQQRSTEKRNQEARHETGALRERARVEAESARLKRESGR
jgi:hypothetical protein